MKPELAENWIDYFLNQENNTPIDIPEGDLTQWQNWWDNAKSGNVTKPPHTTLSAITESHIEQVIPIMPESKVPMEFIKPKKKVVPYYKTEKKEPSASSILW